MEVLILILVLWILVMPIIAIASTAAAKRSARETTAVLEARIRILEQKVWGQERAVLSKPSISAAEFPSPSNDEIPAMIRAESAQVPPLPEPPAVEPNVKPPVPPPLPWPDDPPEPAEPAEPFSLERFMGAKMFAWLGGLAMFCGVLFFVKYAFDNNLIPPWMRVALGFAVGALLLGGGLFTHRLPRYRVLAQAFCATGVVVFYGVSFAAHAVYHLPAFGNLSTFLMMAVVTFGAILIAVRLDALVVAVLGMLGGFITPLLVSTGHDQVFGLFSYIALLDVGLLAVSRHGKWQFLTSWAAACTVLWQVGWCLVFFASGGYDAGAKTLVPMAVFLGFPVLFHGAVAWHRRTDPHAAGSMLALVAAAMGFAFVMLKFPAVASREILLYGFVLLVQIALLVTSRTQHRMAWTATVAAFAVTIHLGCWSDIYLTDGNLVTALALYLIFGILQSVGAWWLDRNEESPDSITRSIGPSWLALLSLVLIHIPILTFPTVPMVVWVAVLLLDLLVVVLAALTGRIVPVLASLTLTMAFMAIGLARMPVEGHLVNGMLFVITGFSTAFVLVGVALSRRGTMEPRIATSIAPLAAIFPFLLMIQVLARFPMPDPSPVFTVALVMAAVLAWLQISGRQTSCLPVALGGMLLVEAVWHVRHFNPANPEIPLVWYAGVWLAFLTLPFVFRRKCADSPIAWITAAAAGPGHFLLFYQVIRRSWPSEFMGWVPAAFALPMLAGIFLIRWGNPPMDANQRSRLAWFGGVALFFLTLIVPIQFERLWITVSWAFEGAALLWLFRKIPHPGLTLTGLALLATAFFRLTLNPAVFTIDQRSGTPILNWYLYTYLTVAAAQFVAAWWYREPHPRAAAFHPRSALNLMGGVLLFFLLNLEIADYFTAAGARFIHFEFGGNFARDMTYSISWGIFALALLIIGFALHVRHARFAAVGLLALTLLKVFLHDLAAIENIYRIGALIGVALIAFAASFLYQRFFDRPDA